MQFDFTAKKASAIKLALLVKIVTGCKDIPAIELL
jgi:hypothetical protein